MLALNLLLCWLTAAEWWSGLPLLLGWGVAQAKKTVPGVYHWELDLPNEEDPAGPSLPPRVWDDYPHSNPRLYVAALLGRMP